MPRDRGCITIVKVEVVICFLYFWFGSIFFLNLVYRKGIEYLIAMLFTILGEYCLTTGCIMCSFKMVQSVLSLEQDYAYSWKNLH